MVRPRFLSLSEVNLRNFAHPYSHQAQVGTRGPISIHEEIHHPLPSPVHLLMCPPSQSLFKKGSIRMVLVPFFPSEGRLFAG